MRQRVAEFDNAEEVVHVFRGNCDRNVLAFLHHFASDFAANVANFAFQVADARLARVTANQSSDGIIGELNVFLVQARLLHLLLH